MPRPLLSEISQNVTLYHRSHYPMKVGDTIKPKRDEDGKHWLEHVPSEVGMELIRREKFSDKPSRFNCVYSSVIPRSRFVDKGILYVVKPRGKIHVANSALIDEIHEKFDRRSMDSSYYTYEKIRELMKEKPEELKWMTNHSLVEQYFTSLGKARKEDIEVLSDIAIIAEIIDDSGKRVEVGKVYEVTQDDTLLFWFHAHPKQKVGGSWNDYDITPAWESFVEKVINSLFSKVESGGTSKYEAIGYLRAGVKLRPVRVRTAMEKSGEEAISGDKEKVGKYTEIMAAFLMDGVWYEPYKTNNGFSFDLKAHGFLKYSYKQPWDYGKFLKKV